MHIALVKFARDAAIILAITLASILALEVGVRALTDVQLQNLGRGIFTAKRFGKSYGNTPLRTSTAFGEIVYTDRNGYRIPHSNYNYPSNPSRRVLLLGDSVAFGLGIADNNTFAHHLRMAHPDWRIENASAVGYSPVDYSNVLASLLERGESYDEILIVICLNDVLYNTADEIQGSLQEPKVEEKKQERKNVLLRLKEVKILQELNDIVKRFSILYVLAKNLVFDVSKAHFEQMVAVYGGAEQRLLSPLGSALEKLRNVQIPFRIFIAPYEYQLRDLIRDNKEGESLVVRSGQKFLPQEKIVSYLKSMGIESIDMAECFANKMAGSSRKLFLAFDAMHFSATGHKLAYECIEQKL